MIYVHVLITINIEESLENSKYGIEIWNVVWATEIHGLFSVCSGIPTYLANTYMYVAHC